MGFGLVQISKMFEAMKYRLTRMVGSVLSVGSFTAIHIVWFKNQVNLIDFLRILSQWYAPMHVPSHQTMADIGALQQMGHFYCYNYCIYAEYKLFLLKFYDLIFNCLKKHCHRCLGYICRIRFSNYFSTSELSCRIMFITCKYS